MLSRVEHLAREAGARILEHYARAEGMVVERKADDSPLTQADRDAHEVIVSGLEKLAPGIPVISEEAEVPPFEIRRGWLRFWLVDPLDGTKEFLNRNGEFTVNVALIERGVPVLGVVLAPALDRLYRAERGEGAWRSEGGAAPVRIFSDPPTGRRPLRVVCSRSHGSDDVSYLLPGWPVAEEVPTGSSLKFCLVAEGRADVYPRKGPTMEWDVAAGDCVYRNSGRNGPRPSPLEYNKLSLKNSSFVIGVDD